MLECMHIKNNSNKQLTEADIFISFTILFLASLKTLDNDRCFFTTVLEMLVSRNIHLGLFSPSLKHRI